MGGLGGHLQHVHEDLDLTFADLKTMLSSLSKESAHLDLHITEKVDGQNIFFNVDMSKGTPVVGFARNLSEAKSPLSIKGLCSKFHPETTGRNSMDLYNAFCMGANVIQEGITALAQSKPDLINGIFVGPYVFVNCEIMCSLKRNVIRYDGNHVVLHNVQIIQSYFDRSSSKPRESMMRVDLFDDHHFNCAQTTYKDHSMVDRTLSMTGTQSVDEFKSLAASVRSNFLKLSRPLEAALQKVESLHKHSMTISGSDNKPQTHEWHVQGPRNTQLHIATPQHSSKASQRIDQILKTINAKLSTLAQSFGMTIADFDGPLNDSSTLKDYFRVQLLSRMVNELGVAALTPDQLHLVDKAVDHVAHIRDGKLELCIAGVERLSTKQAKSLSSALTGSTTKLYDPLLKGASAKKTIGMLLRDIEYTVHDFASESLRDTKSAFASQDLHNEQLHNLASAMAVTLRLLALEGDQSKKEKFLRQSQKLLKSVEREDPHTMQKLRQAASGNMSGSEITELVSSVIDINSSIEGAAFYYHPKKQGREDVLSKNLYKLTGNFAPINQLIGMAGWYIKDILIKNPKFSGRSAHDIINELLDDAEEEHRGHAVAVRLINASQDELHDYVQTAHIPEEHLREDKKKAEIELLIREWAKNKIASSFYRI